MPTTISASIGFCGDAEKALSTVSRHTNKVDGFTVTGNVAATTVAGHTIWDVEIADQGGNKNDLWVVLTSYGISPSKNLGSNWQTVFAA